MAALGSVQEQTNARAVGYKGPFDGKGGFQAYLASNPSAAKQYALLSGTKAAAPAPVATPAPAPKPAPVPAPSISTVPKPVTTAPAPAPAAVAPQPAPVAPAAPVAPPAPAPAPTVSYDPKNALGAAYIQAGYGGGFGAGGADAWDNDPANMAKVNAILEQTGLSRAAAEAANPAAFTTAYEAATNPPASETGVVPVGLVEPLNPWQQNVLQNQANMAPTADDMTQIKSIFQAALDKARAGSDPTQNPQLMNTINQAKEQSLEMRRRLNPQLNQGATAAGAFGGTRDAVQRALADEMIGKNFDATQSGLLNDAYWRGLDANLAQASAQSQLGSQAMSLFDYLQKGALSAGDRVQQQNQALTSAARNEELLKTKEGRDLLSWYMSILGGIPTAGGTTQPQVSNAQAGLGGALAGASLFNSYNNTGNPLSSALNSGFGWAG